MHRYLQGPGTPPEYSHARDREVEWSGERYRDTQSEKGWRRKSVHQRKGTLSVVVAGLP